MEKQKMTIHRALSELKLIDSKITKQITEIVPSGFYQKEKPVNGFIKKDEFEKMAVSKFDSINELIKRKALIKSAIVNANGKTELTVANIKMTIADAINAKAGISYKKLLVEKLKEKHQEAVAQLNRNNEAVERNIQKILEATFGKENVKVGKEDCDNVRKPYMEANEFHLCDPLEVTKKIETMENEIGEFEAEVDAALSEINAITLIEI